MTEPSRGAGQPSWPLAPYQIAVSYGAGSATATTGAGIARGGGADWFGPLDPLKPIAPPEVAGRRFDFPSGYNLVTRPRGYEPIGFAELRGFADAYDLLRLVIETRKDQMERQRWCIRPRAPLHALARATLPRLRGRAGWGAAPDTDTAARIAALQKFWQKPDGVTRWKTWLRSLLEDMFVIDAATLYCRRTRGGQLCALHQLDGATIKRVIDDWGRTPQPYAAPDGSTIYPPAYQQVLKGLPAVDYSVRDIIYRPRNVRAHRVYGYSPVQQVLMTVNIALRRQLWQLDYFSEGSVPDALIGVPAGWTPDQIRQFQDYWDTEFAGDLAKRRHAKFVPGESAVKVHQTKEPEHKHKQDFDEWLARIICYAFSVPPQWAVKLMNRATADNQSAQAEEEGLEPTKEWVKDLVDEVIADEFGSPDLELAWLDEDTGAAQAEARLEARVKIGAATLNELRDALGLDPFRNPVADRPMVLTATGYVPIEAGAGGNASLPSGRSDQAANARSGSPVQKYNPDQPRVPVGQSGGGQWTSEGGGAGSNDLIVAPDSRAASQPVNELPLARPVTDSHVISDATPDNTWKPGAQYAAGVEDDDNESRAAGRRSEGTPAQEVRDDVALAEYRSILAQVRRLDPTWRPRSSVIDPDSVEGDIARLRAATKEAQEHLAQLQGLGFARDPETGRVITPTEPKTGSPRIDSTTDVLMSIFRRVMSQTGPRSDLTPQQYGTLVHTKCAEAIRALNLPGIDTNDVERTFSVDNDDTYGAKDSIRPDVILRDDDGKIIAIYDFKTGRGLPEDRVIRFRYMTESGRTVPVIELSRSRGALSKCK